MKLFLRVEIGDWIQSNYDQSLLHYASSLSSDIMGTDMDSESEGIVADLVLKMIDQSEKVFLLIKVNDPAAPPGYVMRVVQYLSKHPERVDMVVQAGEHQSLETLEAEFTGKLFKEAEPDKIKGLIRKFSQ